MTVLIATANKDLVQDLVTNKLKFVESTKHTCTFNISEKKFEQMLESAGARGYNRYALFTW